MLRLSKLEGDAAFAYALEDDTDPTMLLDTIEQTYFAFRRRVRDINHATSCECNACRLIPELNLKFVVHHGEFVRHRVAGGEELAGSDVIRVHRLLKNAVKDRLGLAGYALVTRECMEALDVDPAALAMSEHHEDQDVAGDAVTYVADLDARWRAEEDRRRVFVDAADAQFEDVVELPAPAAVAWEYVTSPEKRPRWQIDVRRVDEISDGGRRGAGTTNHCVHGNGVAVQEILDWRPFRYFTQRTTFPLVGWWTWTFEFVPLDGDTTELHVRSERLTGFKNRLAWIVMRSKMMSIGRRQGEALRSALAEREAPSIPP